MAETISVRVFFHSRLVCYSSDGKSRKAEVILPVGSRIDDLIAHLRIEQERQHLLISLNGRVADSEQELRDQDKVHLMLPISGG